MRDGLKWPAARRSNTADQCLGARVKYLFCVRVVDVSVVLTDGPRLVEKSPPESRRPAAGLTQTQ